MYQGCHDIKHNGTHHDDIPQRGNTHQYEMTIIIATLNRTMHEVEHCYAEWYAHYRLYCVSQNQHADWRYTECRDAKVLRGIVQCFSIQQLAKTNIKPVPSRHSRRRHDTQHNNIQHKDTARNNTKRYTQHNITLHLGPVS